MRKRKELDQKLRRTGMTFLFGEGLRAKHVIGAKIILALVAALLAGSLRWSFGIPAGILGFLFPDIFMDISNDADNADMLEDIRTLYDTLRIQTRAGVFLTYSFMDCYLAVKHPRMKSALLEFNNQMLAKSSLSQAIDDLESKFDNEYLSSFCIVLRQAMESGKSVQILSDLGNQMSDVEHAMRIRQKEKLDRQIQILQLLLFTGMIGICVYGMGVEVMSTVINF